MKRDTDGLIGCLIGAPVVIGVVLAAVSACLLPFAALAWILTHLFR